MTTLRIADDVAAALTVHAQEKGLSLEGFLTTLVRERDSSQAAVGSKTEESTGKEESTGEAELTGEELETMLRAAAHHGPSPTGTFPRSEIYKDHD